jgi:hypothetical protein
MGLSTSGRRAGAALALATAFFTPAAALAQSATDTSGDFGGVLYIWGAILIFGGLAAGVAAFTVAGRIGRR